MPRPLTLDEIHALLRTKQHGHLGCAFRDRVYVVPMAYGYDGTHLYVNTRPGKKVDYIRRNPWICLTVDDVASPHRWRSVVVDGTVEFLERAEDRRLAARVILAHQGLTEDQTEAFARWGGNHRGIFLRIHVREVTGLAENWPGR